MSGSNTNNTGKTIETHTYATPMANAGSLFSVGVLNVTRPEAKVIELLARVLQNHRNDPSRLATIKLELPRKDEPVRTTDYTYDSAQSDREKRKAERAARQDERLYDDEFAPRTVDDTFQRGVPATRKPTAPAIGDRFSGIEFDE